MFLDSPAFAIRSPKGVVVDERRTVRARLLAAADDERRRVVRDLHDGAQQRLVHTTVLLRLAQQALERDEGDARALIDNALEQAEAATTELRELAHGILPPVLSRRGLRAAVQALAERAAAPVEVEVSVGRLPAVVEATAYFIVAEALTNVAKHARARACRVSVALEGGVLCVEVVDDGVGGADPCGTGLAGLVDRVAALDGRVEITSRPGAGTRLEAAIPVPAPALAA